MVTLGDGPGADLSRPFPGITTFLPEVTKSTGTVTWLENDVDQQVSAGSRRVEHAANGQREVDIAGSGVAGAGNGDAASAHGGGGGVDAGESRAGAAGNGGAARGHGGGHVKGAVDRVGGAVGADGVGGLKVAGLGMRRAVGAEGGGLVEDALVRDGHAVGAGGAGEVLCAGLGEAVGAEGECVRKTGGPRGAIGAGGDRDGPTSMVPSWRSRCLTGAT